MRSFGHTVEYHEKVDYLHRSKINVIDSLVLGEALDHMQSTAINIGLIHQVDRSIKTYNVLPLIVTGLAAKMDLVENFEVNTDAIHVVKPGMDAKWKVKDAHSDTIRNLLCISNYLPGKGIDVLLAALAPLKRFDWKLTIAGNPHFDPDYFLGIQREIKEKELEERIELFGILPRERINDLMIKSDVLINFSESETYGMVVKEAIRARLPVVMYETGAWNEFEESGLVTVLKEYSVEYFSNALKEILKSGIQVDSKLLTKKTRIRTWEEVSREIESILQNC